MLALLGACNSSEPFPPDATFTGRWAGRPWAGEGSATIVEGGDAGDTLHVFASRPVNAGSMPLESIRIRVLFNGAGSYQLGSGGAGSAQLLELTGGDVVSAVYSTTAADAGTLTITSYDAAGGTIEGHVAFVAASSSEYRSYGATAAFEDGAFSARIFTPR